MSTARMTKGIPAMWVQAESVSPMITYSPGAGYGHLSFTSQSMESSKAERASLYMLSESAGGMNVEMFRSAVPSVA